MALAGKTEKESRARNRGARNGGAAPAEVTPR